MIHIRRKTRELYIKYTLLGVLFSNLMYSIAFNSSVSTVLCILGLTALTINIIYIKYYLNIMETSLIETEMALRELMNAIDEKKYQDIEDKATN